MTRSGSDLMWSIGGHYDVVPAAPNGTLAAILGAWWTLPRTFGCASARRSPWWSVIPPAPEVWCAGCAVRVYAGCRTCVYCAQRLRLAKSESLIFEMGQQVRVLARAHRHCAERAAKEDG